MEEADLRYMQLALQEAKAAAQRGEIPVGALVVCRNRIIARAHNLTETLGDVTAHAEMQAVTAAANVLGGKYLVDCTLYVTLEPCVMCAGALSWSQLSRLVYGAFDEKKGFHLYENSRSLLHPKTEVKGGILESDCAALLKNFFKTRRK